MSGETIEPERKLITIMVLTRAAENVKPCRRIAFSALLIAMLAAVYSAGLEARPIQTAHPAFGSVVETDATLDTVAAGLEFTEGPVWIPRQGGGHLLFSDIPANRIYRWTGSDGLSVWRTPSGKSNGLILDSGGRLIACEHGNRRVSLVHGPDSAATLCDTYRGGRLNSPNDAAVGEDGTIWFTDPPYGLEGREQEQDASYVFRLPPGESEPVAVVEDFDRPNGIVFSPNRRILYIADSGRPAHIRRFQLDGEGGLTELGVFAPISPGAPDGMCVDVMGRLYTSAGDGVHVLSPDGVLLGKILTPRRPTNCCFGGDDFRTLFITAREDVYAVKLKVRGLP